ncbi:DUF4037 domain-containing protein, partial [Nanoarchaeota archaeon]
YVLGIVSLLASQWTRISQEEPFMGRCGELDDEIGSRIVATRLVQDIMKLCFLMERKYTPYIKWFGTEFKNLKISKKLTPTLLTILRSKDWKNREKYLCQAYRILAKKHNSLKITKPMHIEVRKFFSRPFLVIKADLFATEIKKKIRDPKVKSLPDIGSINQFSDSTNVLENDTRRFKVIYKR